MSCQSYSIKEFTVNSCVTYSLFLFNFSITNASGTKGCSSSSIQHMIHYQHPLPLSNYIPLNTAVNSIRQKAPCKSIYVSMYVYFWSIINLKDLWWGFLYTGFNGSIVAGNKQQFMTFITCSAKGSLTQRANDCTNVVFLKVRSHGRDLLCMRQKFYTCVFVKFFTRCDGFGYDLLCTYIGIAHYNHTE